MSNTRRLQFEKHVFPHSKHVQTQKLAEGWSPQEKKRVFIDWGYQLHESINTWSKFMTETLTLRRYWYLNKYKTLVSDTYAEVFKGNVLSEIYTEVCI